MSKYPVIKGNSLAVIQKLTTSERNKSGIYAQLKYRL